MSRWFYSAWALAVLLAFVLPVAIPYAVWPPREGRQTDLVAECGRRAKNNAILGTHPVASLWPLSVTVSVCESSPHLFYVAEVSARGPYGIPFASSRVTTRNIEALNPDGGFVIGSIALLTGVAVVSMPFGYFWLRHVVRRRLQLAA
ncbi:MAG: hypothetical protein IIC26_05590 [Chloroflexi bacterium]|nr:hypothetical protein [Chloroflexota bacterium]MCH8901624.1 hypothetical protein [Chloroflexota bacterium]